MTKRLQNQLIPLDCLQIEKQSTREPGAYYHQEKQRKKMLKDLAFWILSSYF